MPRFSNDTLATIKALIDGVDGYYMLKMYAIHEHEPKGKLQDCDTKYVKTEWIYQEGPGMSGDDYYGTVTWLLGDFYVVAHFAV
jgi:hypothetical protein